MAVFWIINVGSKGPFSSFSKKKIQDELIVISLLKFVILRVVFVAEKETSVYQLISIHVKREMSNMHIIQYLIQKSADVQTEFELS